MANRKRAKRRRGRTRSVGDILLAATLMAATALAAAWLDASNSQSVTGSVTVMDGDSLRLDGVEIRLVGIDAPEFAQVCERSGEEWPCGRAARTHLKALVEGNRPITCSGSVEDKYQRLLAVCTGSGKELNAAMVRDGMAAAYGDYWAEEAAARAEKAGIWAGNSQRPQDFRASRRDETFEENTVSVMLQLRLYARQTLRWLTTQYERMMGTLGT